MARNARHMALGAVYDPGAQHPVTHRCRGRGTLEFPAWEIFGAMMWCSEGRRKSFWTNLVRKTWILDLWEGGLGGGVFLGPTPRGGWSGTPPLLPPHP